MAIDVDVLLLDGLEAGSSNGKGVDVGIERGDDELASGRCW